MDIIRHLLLLAIGCSAIVDQTIKITKPITGESFTYTPTADIQLHVPYANIPYVQVCLEPAASKGRCSEITSDCNCYQYITDKTTSPCMKINTDTSSNTTIYWHLMKQPEQTPPTFITIQCAYYSTVVWQTLSITQCVKILCNQPQLAAPILPPKATITTTVSIIVDPPQPTDDSLQNTTITNVAIGLATIIGSTIVFIIISNIR